MMLQLAILAIMLLDRAGDPGVIYSDMDKTFRLLSMREDTEKLKPKTRTGKVLKTIALEAINMQLPGPRDSGSTETLDPTTSW